VKNSARTSRVAVSADGKGLVSRAGAVLLWETMRVTGLGRGLAESLARWRGPRAVHDPGKLVADLAAAARERAWALAGDAARLHCSVGMTITADIQAAIGKVPAGAWTPACDGDGEVRKGAWAADVTGLLDLDGWPAGMRVIVRRERPPPGAQLRFTGIDGRRFTCLATDAEKGQLADLGLSRRRRARCEDRIRCAKDTGLRNLPLKGSARNQLWCEIAALACELPAWTRMPALAGAARRREPGRLRLRLFCTAGRLASSGRRLRLRLAERWPWTAGLTAAAGRLQALPSG
jgi:Transposase DDE domain group 1